MHNDFDIFRTTTIEKIINALEEGRNCYLCDLHHELFSTDYEYTYTEDAISNLGDEVFDAIAKIVKYEKDNFGEVSTDFSNPCAIANMLFYIVGEEEMYNLFDGCDLYDNMWNEKLDNDKCNLLLQWLKDKGRI